MMPMNAGIAVYFPVRKRSMRLLRSASLLRDGFTTVWSTRCVMKSNRMSAMAAARSRPRSLSI